jgi:hypothetical protein
VRVSLFALLAAVAAAFALAPPGSATSECHGIPSCIRVPGPWVVVPAHGTAEYLLTCPNGRSVVGGLDAQATSRDVRVSFDGRLGAPVQPGQTTTRYAFFHAVSVSGKRQAFQPLLGCIPTQGGGGRSTVSARVVPVGQSIEYRSRVVVVGPGDVKSARVSCQPHETLVGAWHGVAFRTKTPPALGGVGLVHARHLTFRNTVVVTVTSTDTLNPDANAVVQVGAVCAP